MSRRTKYQHEIDTTPGNPTDGDYYVIMIRPPRTTDGVYCRVEPRGRSWGRSGYPVESRTEAIEYIRDKLEELERKATDDKRHPGVNAYPEPPKPSNTLYVVHPDFEGEISPREVWGDATLSSFGVETGSKYADREWYETRETYQQWLAPLRDDESAALRLYALHLTEMEYWWYSADGNGGVDAIRYASGSDRVKDYTASWTSATRQVGGIGLTSRPPADLRRQEVSETPLGVDDAREWIDDHEVEALDRQEANQIEDDEEMPTRGTEADDE